MKKYVAFTLFAYLFAFSTLSLSVMGKGNSKPEEVHPKNEIGVIGINHEVVSFPYYVIYISSKMKNPNSNYSFGVSHSDLLSLKGFVELLPNAVATPQGTLRDYSQSAVTRETHFDPNILNLLVQQKIEKEKVDKTTLLRLVEVSDELGITTISNSLAYCHTRSSIVKKSIKTSIGTSQRSDATFDPYAHPNSLIRQMNEWGM